jgi:hypothetical protein
MYLHTAEMKKSLETARRDSEHIAAMFGQTQRLQLATYTFAL